MNPSTLDRSVAPDSAGVFAVAHSLWQACFEAAERDERSDLSAAYNGIDQLMREVMRVGVLFEEWACTHVDFDEFGEVWPYFIAGNFGNAWVELGSACTVDQFDENECLRIAWHLGMPLRVDGTLPLPVDQIAENSVLGSKFSRFRIQTVRRSLEDDDIEPFTPVEEFFDEEFGPVFFALYGVFASGELEHIADRDTYAAAVELAQNLAPGVPFPVPLVVRRKTE